MLILSKEELERRNNKIAVTLFWLSRIATDLPIFSVIEHNRLLVEKTEIDGAEKMLGGLDNEGNNGGIRQCTNHNKVL